MVGVVTLKALSLKVRSLVCGGEAGQCPRTEDSETGCTAEGGGRGTKGEGHEVICR